MSIKSLKKLLKKKAREKAYKKNKNMLKNNIPQNKSYGKIITKDDMVVVRSSGKFQLIRKDNKLKLH